VTVLEVRVVDVWVQVDQMQPRGREASEYGQGSAGLTGQRVTGKKEWVLKGMKHNKQRSEGVKECIRERGKGSVLRRDEE